MFPFSRYKIVKNHLGYKQGRFPVSHWWMKDESLSFLTEEVSEILKDTGNPSVKGVEILKLTRRKGIYRVFNPDDASQSYVIKIFFLRHLSHRLSFHRYGLDEAANFITASSRGIKTPELLAYGQYYARSCLIKVGVVVTGDLRGYQTIGKLLEESDESEHGEMLGRTIPVFCSLYHSGCNHIDVNSGAILLGEDKLNGDAYLLDFQHAQFYDSASMEILMFEAAYFARACQNMISNEVVMLWRDDLLAAVDVTGAEDLEKCKDLFDYYLHCEGNKSTQNNLSRKQRKRIR